MYDEIFKSYDIRGVVPDQLSSDFAYTLGRAVVSFFNCTSVYIGSDMRVSSPELKEALLKGVSDQGAKAIDLGQVSTDTTYYASGKYNAPSIMITASHNPSQYNGFKICKEGAQALSYDEGLKHIKKLVSENNFADPAEKGEIVQEDVLSDYIDHLLTLVGKDTIKEFTIVADAGNGMAGALLPLLASKLPQLKIIPLYFELDGTFPNHPANPIDPANIQDLIAKVKETSADLGLAFDGDADRVYLVDNNGESVSASITGSMVAKALLKEHPGSVITYNIVSSWIVPETIKKYGGESILTKVGHSLIKPIMREKNAVFGTEHSGHYFFRDLYFADSGLLTALFVLQLLSTSEGKLDSVLEEFKTYHAISETNSKVTDKEKVLTALSEKYKDAEGVVTFLDIDGIRVDFLDWWFNVRPSNTEPLLRLNLEAKSKQLMEEKKEELLSFIRQFE